LGSKVVKNGLKITGTQNYLCTKCKKQFQSDYFYLGCQKDVKLMILRMLVNGNGVRDICRIALVSAGCVLRTLLSIGNLITIEPQRKHYHKVQIDELYSFVGSKKKKVWIIYAYDAFTGEILGVTAGKRSKKHVRDLIKRLGDIEVDWWCTDAWKAFAQVLPYERHLIGKKFTKAIEGVNTALRNSCKRLHRRTTAFSKKLQNHWNALKIAINNFNNKPSYN